MASTFLLWHSYVNPDLDREHKKFLGVYSSEAKARAAIEHLRKRLGFCDHPDGFWIDECRDRDVDRIRWPNGFITLGRDDP